MGTKERRTREKEETRQRIMDAARRLFVEQGYDAVSMRKIAEAIEYSPTAVYVHFADKDALIRAMIMDDFARLDAEALRLASIADPVERIRQIGLGYVKFGIAHPHHYRLMFMSPLPVRVDDEHKVGLDDPTKSGYGMLKQAVRECLEAGRLRPEAGKDVELVAQMLWAGVHGVASLRIAMSKDPCVQFHDPEGLTHLMVESLVRGTLLEKGPEKKPKAVAKARSY